MTKIAILLSLCTLLYSCCGTSHDDYAEHSVHPLTDVNHSNNAENDENVEIQSDYDMDMVDADDMEEFKESLAQIEKEHGEQWDFCTCVVKNDSINKAVMEASDSEIDGLFERLEVIDQHCKAFLVQNPNATPEERAKHEKKVKKCLKEAGVK